MPVDHCRRTGRMRIDRRNTPRRYSVARLNGTGAHCRSPQKSLPYHGRAGRDIQAAATTPASGLRSYRMTTDPPAAAGRRGHQAWNDIEEDAMDPERARRLLQAERDEVQELLSEATSAGRQDGSPSGKRETPPIPRNRSPTKVSTTQWLRRCAVGSRRSLVPSNGQQWDIRPIDSQRTSHSGRAPRGRSRRRADCRRSQKSAVIAGRCR